MIYLDNAATSRYKPQAVIDAFCKECSYSANPGRGGHDESFNAGLRVYNTRKIIKDALDIDDSYEVIFTSNCTEALNLGILGLLSEKEGCPHVITTVCEHNSVLRPLHRLFRQGKIELEILSPEVGCAISPNAVISALRDDTALVALNHVSNVTGVVCEVGEIGKVTRERQIPLLLDCAQSMGHCEIHMDDMGIDMLAAAGHKGLHGLQGTGFLAMKNDMRLVPLKYGGTGTNSESVDQPEVLPESLESGTLNTCGIVALGEAVKWTQENFNNLHHVYRYLSSELSYGLKQIKGIQLYSGYPSPVISFNVLDYSSTDVADYLNTLGIAVRSGLHCAPLMHKHLGTLQRGTIRASLGYNNTIFDIKKLLIAVENLVKNQSN